MSEVKDLQAKLEALNEVIASQDKLIEAQGDMITLLKRIRKVQTDEQAG